MTSRNLAVATSIMASTARLWRGTMASRKQTPAAGSAIDRLKLYDREGCIECRLVREALTELNLDLTILPVPLRGNRYLDALRADSGSTRVPFLVDTTLGRGYAGASSIIEFLFGELAGRSVPRPLRESTVTRWMSQAATAARMGRGRTATPSKPAAKLLRLYNFESSPYSRLVRERLTELELGYELINLSKQRFSDLGPAVQRLHLGDYEPVPGSKRAEFLAKHGRVQVPFLEDPNTGVSLFESARILQYLDDHYSLSSPVQPLTTTRQ